MNSLFFTDPNKQSKHVNRAVVGGVMAGLVFLFLVSILSLIAVKLLNRKRKREQTARYGECSKQKELIKLDVLFCL